MRRHGVELPSGRSGSPSSPPAPACWRSSRWKPSWPGPSPSVAASPAASASPARSGSPLASSTLVARRPPVRRPAASPSRGLGPKDDNTCYSCHKRIDGGQQLIAEQWQASVHGQNGIGCADCHGGDPTSDKITVSMDPANGFRVSRIARRRCGLCGTCHSDVERMRSFQVPTDQYAKYRSSVHGQRLLNLNDTRVAICIDCHGTHDVKKASDPTAKVYPLNVPALCASCHSDPKVMDGYDIPTNQFDIYKESVHGQVLLDQQATCAPPPAPPATAPTTPSRRQSTEVVGCVASATPRRRRSTSRVATPS